LSRHKLDEVSAGWSGFGLDAKGLHGPGSTALPTELTATAVRRSLLELRCRKDRKAVWRHGDYQDDDRAPPDGAGRTVTIMPVLTILISLLLRAHIPNQPRFGSGPANASDGGSPVHILAIVLIAVALISTVLWLAVGLAIGIL
jgi:hypothetical protein